MERSTKNIKENKMGTMTVNKLLISMSLPMIISMLVQALYNVVDSMFVAQISENALTAVSLAFPLQSLMIAVGVGTGVGVNAVLSKSLGQKDFESANKAASNGIILSFLSYVIFALIGVFLTGVFFKSQTSNVEIINHGSQYIYICTILSVGLFGQIILERLLQSTGKTFYTMITQGIGAIINIILDPILIFGLFGAPEMGVAGAAVATVTGQIIAMFLALYFNLKKNHEIKLNKKVFKLDIKIIKRIYAVGVPSIVMQSIGSVMTFGLNKILIGFTPTATAVFGVYFKLQSFVFMPVFGLNNGMVPIVAYNYGAKNEERVTKTIKLSTIYAMGIMLVGFLIFQAFPKQLLCLFNASEDMLRIGIPALRIISINFIFAGFCVIASSVFQALENGMLSLVVSAVRQLIAILPLAFIFGQVFGVNAIWFAFPVSEIIAVILSAMFMKKVYNEAIKPISMIA
ncbi:Multidrug export protein mepA [Sarcina ventriculi]|uniref:MATE family efflux transporter n=1 Tax=Sarcina ventriculi TaxID=1267 RepID=UPI000D993999|nr:MATE family efflux transporter [Sarcina ventriculi]SPZ50017.1 Multidrug export protein mepA [Sarcina ventriculi]